MVVSKREITVSPQRVPVILFMMLRHLLQDDLKYSISGIEVRRGPSSLKPRKVCIREYGTGAPHKVTVEVNWTGLGVKYIRKLLAGLIERPHVLTQFSKAATTSRCPRGHCGRSRSGKNR